VSLGGGHSHDDIDRGKKRHQSWKWKFNGVRSRGRKGEDKMQREVVGQKRRGRLRGPKETSRSRRECFPGKGMGKDCVESVAARKRHQTVAEKP